MQYLVILLAAGSGTRMKSELPKPLLPLAGVPVLFWSIRTFLQIPEIGKIVVLIPEGARSEFESVATLLPAERLADIFFVVGGNTRKESVANGLEALKALAATNTEHFVLVHDAARPFVTESVVRNVLTAVQEQRAVTVAVPVIDSIKRVDAAGRVVESIDRKGLWAIQTPQAFELSLLEQAHENGNPLATDDAMLVEPHHPVSIVVGEPGNFKITTPDDYQYACYLAEKSS